MNGLEKSGIAKSFLGFVCASIGLIAASSVGSADADRYVVVEEAQSLQQIVERELQSARFAKQIANYNGIKSVTSIVPVDTTIQIPKPYLSKRDFGQVVFTKGDVVHTQESLVVNPPARGAYVHEGDVFTTGEDGFISLKFMSGSVVNVQPESRVSIEDIDCADIKTSCVIALNAHEGEIESQITPRPAGQPPVKFTVSTPFLSAAVRGTAFYVNVNEGADRIGVTHGLVATDVAGKTNDLPKGKGLLAEASAEPALVDLLDAPQFIVGAESVLFSAQDRIRWKALPGAQKYRLTIAADEKLSQPILLSDVQQSSAALPESITAGQYYLSVAGIDNNAFLGLPAETQISYAEIDDREKLQLQILRTEGQVKITPSDYEGSIEYVVSNGFDNPTEQRRLVRSSTDSLSLDLDPAQDWVVQARKVFSINSVSVYSDEYLLEASK